MLSNGSMQNLNLKSELISMLIKSESNTKNKNPINSQSNKSIAIACALSSRGMNESERSDIFKHHFIKDFMPSFCKTATTGYKYSFYLR